MNLIERLGGYEKAKKELKIRISKGFVYSVIELEEALLEYRRQHNIFEVGDKVIKIHPKNTILWPVLGVYKNGGVWLDYKGFAGSRQAFDTPPMQKSKRVKVWR